MTTRICPTPTDRFVHSIHIFRRVGGPLAHCAFLRTAGFFFSISRESLYSVERHRGEVFLVICHGPALPAVRRLGNAPQRPGTCNGCNRARPRTRLGSACERPLKDRGAARGAGHGSASNGWPSGRHHPSPVYESNPSLPARERLARAPPLPSRGV